MKQADAAFRGGLLDTIGGDFVSEEAIMYDASHIQVLEGWQASRPRRLRECVGKAHPHRDNGAR